ncbi:MAG TPA: hypothetical protein DF282_06330, partial [Hyphomonas sp.]|nr:hypothetical protein [Hyphomonas sp.]
AVKGKKPDSTDKATAVLFTRLSLKQWAPGGSNAGSLFIEEATPDLSKRPRSFGGESGISAREYERHRHAFRDGLEI